MERYTPGKLWSILLDGSDDVDELIDLQVGLDMLPIQERVFLDYIREGYTGAEALRESGLKDKHQTQAKRKVLKHLAKLMNGD